MSDYLSLRHCEIIEPAILRNCQEIKHNNSHYFVRQQTINIRQSAVANRQSAIGGQHSK